MHETEGTNNIFIAAIELFWAKKCILFIYFIQLLQVISAVMVF